MKNLHPLPRNASRSEAPPFPLSLRERADGRTRPRGEGHSRVLKQFLIPFILTLAQSYCADAPPYGDNVQFRGSLANSRLQFERAKKGRVAFIGGSITEM